MLFQRKNTLSASVFHIVCADALVVLHDKGRDQAKEQYDIKSCRQPAWKTATFFISTKQPMKSLSATSWKPRGTNMASGSRKASLISASEDNHVAGSTESAHLS